MAQRLTARQKVQRDAEVVHDRVRGLTWALIARRHKLSERQAQTVWKEWAAGTEIADGEALERAKEAIAQIEAVIEDCVLLAESTKNDSVRLGAIKTRLNALMQRFVLMQAVGLLPRDLGVLETQVQAQEVSKAIISVFREFDVPVAAMRKIQSLLTPTGAKLNGTASAST